ncbi:unnamed protein product [marine sediment metagenome]|uniref:Uncharacterized protein n=1 Tax=marine sediment metagenome TaxID=412755 RepID=X1SCY9_9ZZZZ
MKNEASGFNIVGNNFSMFIYFGKHRIYSPISVFWNAGIKYEQSKRCILGDKE